TRVYTLSLHDALPIFGGTDGNGLQVARDLAEAGERKDAVQIVQDGVDPGELIEHSDGDGQENGDAVFCGEERVALDVLRVDGLYDFSQLLVRIFFTGQAKHVPGFVRSSLLDQPARALGYSKKHRQEKQ